MPMVSFKIYLLWSKSADTIVYYDALGCGVLYGNFFRMILQRLLGLVFWSLPPVTG